jgi:hypothetical protein
MRVYSNTLLGWPQSLHIVQIARLYLGPWQHYHYYRINSTSPLILTTNSPIEPLQENCHYYCYNSYLSMNPELINNSFKRIWMINNKTHIKSQPWVYIPKDIEPNDIIVIQDIKDSSYLSPIILQ